MWEAPSDRPRRAQGQPGRHRADGAAGLSAQRALAGPVVGASGAGAGDASGRDRAPGSPLPAGVPGRPAPRRTLATAAGRREPAAAQLCPDPGRRLPAAGLAGLPTGPSYRAMGPALDRPLAGFRHPGLRLLTALPDLLPP